MVDLQIPWGIRDVLGDVWVDISALWLKLQTSAMLDKGNAKLYVDVKSKYILFLDRLRLVMYHCGCIKKNGRKLLAVTHKHHLQAPFIDVPPDKYCSIDAWATYAFRCSSMAFCRLKSSRLSLFPPPAIPDIF
jgi:hypothetical protein